MNKQILIALVAIVIVGGVLLLARGGNNKESTMESNNLDTKIEVQNTVVIETEKGEIEIELLPDLAPGHVENFRKLASSGFYDGTRFHRVIEGFMVQGGDPLTKDEANRMRWGTGGPGYEIKAEFTPTPHTRGMVSMARSTDPDSAGSQFFIVVADSNFLDGQYTVFGRVTKGMEVADAIVEASEGQEIPAQPVLLLKASVK